MLKIDLLKGSGLPASFNPKTFFRMAVPLVIPGVLVLFMFGYFFTQEGLIVARKTAIARTDAALTRYAKDVQYSKDVDVQTKKTQQTLEEVAGTVNQYIPFSPVLQAVAECMPVRMALKKMDIKQIPIKKPVPDRKEPGRMVDAVFVQRALSMSVYDSGNSASDVAIKEYISKLSNSSLLMPLIEDIRIVSNYTEEVDNKKVTCYDIECMFKLKE